MSYDPSSKPEETQSPTPGGKGVFGVIIHSFFVVPFLLAVLSILLFAAVRILTMEQRSVYDYLRDVKTGGDTKRWQGAFELSRILSVPSAVPKEDKFVDEMIKAFEVSKNDDDRVRQYLALAMARTGNERFVGPLLSTLAPAILDSSSGVENLAATTEKNENLYAIITALGILKNSTATDALLKYLNHDSSRIRLATVIALGNIMDAKAVEPLKPMLEDPEPNIIWDAAIALAKMGDRAGRGVILKLLDRAYLDSFTNVNPSQQSRIMQVAMQASSDWNDPEIKTVLQGLFLSDKNMNVRALAQKALDVK